jgi:Siphovirus Gp157
MSGASEARTALIAALKRSYGGVHNAGRDYATAYTAALAADDLVIVFAHGVEAIQALGHLHETAEVAEKEARAELARLMLETGCHQIAAGNSTASLVRRRPFVVIDDPALIPAEFMHQPEPIPDKAKIKAAIADGLTVAGAAMLVPNDSYISIRSRSSKP